MSVPTVGFHLQQQWFGSHRIGSDRIPRKLFEWMADLTMTTMTTTLMMQMQMQMEMEIEMEMDLAMMGQ
ncbi:GL24829 [Drosophila persimilis]|uniref:GL24829 n=1 Tax=Drosophila persimilis TaxID=7234 RepID=B4GS10_DROPE|nr:GL24829 [Drosophila persimilis]